MQHKLRQIITSIRLPAGIFFLVLVVFFTRGTWEELYNITKISVASLIILSILFIVQQLLTGYRLKVFTELFDVKLKLCVCFGLVNIRSLANLLPFNAGAVHNAVYLKIHNNLPVASYISIFAVNACLSILTSGIFGMLLLMIRVFFYGQLNITLAFLSAAFILVSVLALSIPIPMIKRSNKVSDWIRNAQEGWRICKGTKSILLKIMLLHLCLLSIMSAELYIIFRDVGYTIDLPAILFITAATVLLRFTTVIPGNIGIRESLMGGITELFGFSFKTGVLGSIIERIIALFWTFLFGILFSLILTRGKEVSLGSPERRLKWEPGDKGINS